MRFGAYEQGLKSKRIVDLGCGTGPGTRAMSNQFPDAQVGRKPCRSSSSSLLQ